MSDNNLISINFLSAIPIIGLDKFYAADRNDNTTPYAWFFIQLGVGFFFLLGFFDKISQSTFWRLFYLIALIHIINTSILLYTSYHLPTDIQPGDQVETNIVFKFLYGDKKVIYNPYDPSFVLSIIGLIVSCLVAILYTWRALFS